MDMKTEFKKILEHHFSEQLGEGAADDIAGEMKDKAAEVISNNMKRTVIGEERSMPNGTIIYFVTEDEIQQK